MNDLNETDPFNLNGYDTLVVSDDQLLFEQIREYLTIYEPHRQPALLQDIACPEPLASALAGCDLLIYDIRSSSSALAKGARVFEAAPTQTFSIGLSDTPSLPAELIGSPVSLHLSGVINVEEGWEQAWKQIQSIQSTWRSPLMTSRIEEVPVSDILQMISIGGWDAIVQIEGETDTGSPERLRGGIYFWSGSPRIAWSSRHTGIQAIYDLLSLKNGFLRVIRPTWSPCVQNVHDGMEEILLSFAVATDEARLRSEERAREPAEFIVRLPEAKSAQPAEPAAAAQPASAPAVRFRVNGWWAQDLSPLSQALAATEPGSLPLRWMKPLEVQRLAEQAGKSEFLLLKAPRQFHHSLLGLIARGYSAERFDQGLLPTVRLGRCRGTCLYLLCIEAQVDEAGLSGFPLVAHCPPGTTRQELDALTATGYPAVLLMTPDATRLSTELAACGPQSAPWCCIETPAESCEAMIATLIDIIATISQGAAD